jgi:hypothetical protein
MRKIEDIADELTLLSEGGRTTIVKDDDVIGKEGKDRYNHE